MKVTSHLKLWSRNRPMDKSKDQSLIWTSRILQKCWTRWSSWSPKVRVKTTSALLPYMMSSWTAILTFTRCRKRKTLDKYPAMESSIKSKTASLSKILVLRSNHGNAKFALKKMKQKLKNVLFVLKLSHLQDKIKVQVLWIKFSQMSKKSHSSVSQKLNNRNLEKDRC
jgi:hypothetical protein